MKKIGQAMKNHPVSDERVRLLKLRDDLQAELLAKQELIRELRQQLAVKEAYLLGMFEGSNAAPSAELLDSLVS